METPIPARPAALDAQPPRPCRRPTAVALILALATAVTAAPSSASGEVARVSENANGRARGDSAGGAMSFDGRLVAFTSTDFRLVRDDSNGEDADVFIRDMQTGAVELVSLDNANEPLRIQGSGSPAGSDRLALSDTGRYVAFNAAVVANNGLTAARTFVRDRQRRTTLQVPIEGGGQLAHEQQANADSIAISGNGRIVAVVLNGAITFDGRRFCGFPELFVHDRVTGSVERITRDVARTNLCPIREISDLHLSSDGRYLAFTELYFYTRELSGLFVYDQRNRQRTRVDVNSDGIPANGQSSLKAISPDARYVLFGSSANNLVSGDSNGESDVFLHDLRTRETTRVNVSSSGSQATGYTDFMNPMTLSADARFVAFTSYSSNLDPDSAPSGALKIYIRDREAQTTVSTGIDSTLGSATPRVGTFSSEGRFLTFNSYGENSNLNGRKGHWDVFRLDRTVDPSLSADVSISQLVPSAFEFGHPITYTVSTVNRGTDSAESVNVIDRLPSSARFLSATASQGSCSGESILVCRLGSLAPGAVGTVTFTVEPKWALTSSLTNSVSVNAAPLDPDVTNNRSVVSIPGLR
ncbi:DUF11 domain-containing protein [Methylotetracoccus oryzae]|uniref:DUF11 domain-containing protein n=1 Tax=Methylotetracoccus oryzae TaxID=1919059 RepID=UPI0013A599B1|nr:DUF11 domain-containing protein [Methylotetracoccus oryzae]